MGIMAVLGGRSAGRVLHGEHGGFLAGEVRQVFGHERSHFGIVGRGGPAARHNAISRYFIDGAPSAFRAAG